PPPPVPPTLSLHDALPISLGPGERIVVSGATTVTSRQADLRWTGDLRVDEGLIELRGGEAPRLPDDVVIVGREQERAASVNTGTDRKSTRLNSSHVKISYA